MPRVEHMAAWVLKDHQVFGPVICAIPVYMVDDFPTSERTPKLLLGDELMLIPPWCVAPCAEAHTNVPMVAPTSTFVPYSEKAHLAAFPPSSRAPLTFR
jgi:hypothetical protein